MEPSNFLFVDFHHNLYSARIELLFPSWEPGNERVVLLSPHDNDALLGAGYLVQACLAVRGEVYLLILCDGSAGYSTQNQKDTIVAMRKTETLAAYHALGISSSHIFRFDYPDFSLEGFLGFFLTDGTPGAMQRTLPVLRSIRPTRLLISNGLREHSDHQAAEQIGRYVGPQVGDPVLVDMGVAPPIRSYLQYSVWGDFDPEDAFLEARPMTLRANRAVLAPPACEARVVEGLQAFQSQTQIIQGLVAARQARQHNDRWLELYLAFDPRPALDYQPYHQTLRNMGI